MYVRSRAHLALCEVESIMGGKLHDLICRLHIFKCQNLNYAEFKAELKLLLYQQIPSYQPLSGFA